MALIGILFGLGRLSMFRYQCQVRLDRQRELDRTLAARSALRWLETTTDSAYLLKETNVFTYAGASDRMTEVTVRKVPSIYPAPGDARHFDIARGRAGLVDARGSYLMETTHASMQPRIESDDDGHILKMGSEGVTGQTSRVAIDMDGVGCWLDELYGRRYWIGIEDVNRNQDPTGDDDLIRLVITPKGTEFANPSTPAIWITQGNGEHGAADKSIVTLHSRYGGVTVERLVAGISYADGKGVQLAGNRATLFSWTVLTTPDAPGRYDFTHGDCVLPDALVDAFSGRDLRVQLEVESRAPESEPNQFRWLRVDPAYEYAIDEAWTSGTGEYCREQATVVHLRPNTRTETGRSFTYETHATRRER